MKITDGNFTVVPSDPQWLNSAELSEQESGTKSGTIPALILFGSMLLSGLSQFESELIPVSHTIEEIRERFTDYEVDHGATPTLLSNEIVNVIPIENLSVEERIEVEFIHSLNDNLKDYYAAKRGPVEI